MKVVSAETMRELDRQTIEAGTPGEILMQRAGEGAYEVMKDVFGYPLYHARHVVVAGKGNNGGDGYVYATHCCPASEPEERVLVYSLVPLADLTGDAKTHMEKAKAAGVPIIEATDGPPADAFRPDDVIVDAMLGTGATGALRPPYGEWVAAINASGAPVVAMDIPTGVNADTGEVVGEAVRADVTTTFALPKPGLLLGEGADHAGQIRVVDIGFSTETVASAPSELVCFAAADARPLLGRLPVQLHKSSAGRVLVMAGHRDYPGAPLLAGEAALRMGGGLVTVAYPDGATPYLGQRPNALIMRAISDAGYGRHGVAGLNELRALAEETHCAVIGPGLGRHDDTLDVAAQIAAIPPKLVLDADGLLLVARDTLRRPADSVTVLTPHPGEFRRIAEGRGNPDILDCDRRAQAVWLAELTGAIVVLKGPRTVVAAPDGRLSINTSGSQALATGGTGDVLTGVVATCLCQQSDPFAAVCLAVFVHGRAGEPRYVAKRALIADGLLTELSAVMLDLSPHA